MKKLFTIISAIGFVIMTSCSPTKTVQTNEAFSAGNSFGVSVTSVKTLKPDTLTSVQMDSVINADKLPVLSKWTQSAYKDAETNQSVTYKTLFDSTTNIVYTVKVIGPTLYVLSKRTVTTK